MKPTAEIFSLIFFLESLLVIYLGVYIVKLNPKKLTNKLFFLVALSLAIWSFGFAMANSQSSAEAAVLWRRFSALGWTLILTFTLHFFIVLCKRETKTIFLKHIYIIYLPSLVNLFIFSLSTNMASVQYNLVQIDSGWTNIAVNNFYDYYYYFHYAVYFVANVVVVTNWVKDLKGSQRIRQAKIILLAMLFAGVIGSVVDLFANSFLSNPIPQVAPLFIFFPVWAMNHAVKNYDMFNSNKIYLDEIIISTDQQKKIFLNLSLILIVSGFGYFLFEYFSIKSLNPGNLYYAITKGGLLSSLGFILYVNQYTKRNRLKEIVNIFIIVLSIPITSILYINYSAITVWSYTFIILISSLLFNRRYLLVFTTIAAIISQRIIWILRPESYILVEKSDFLLRITFILIAFHFGNYVNKVYIAKTKENKYQLEFQKLVSETSFDFINFNQENSNQMINSLLEKLGKFFDVDRTYLFTIDQSDKTLTYANEWCKAGISQEVGTIEDEPKANFKWWVGELKNNFLVKIDDVSIMPKVAKAEQDQLLRQKVKSLLSVPIMSQGKLLAFIGMDSVVEKKSWTNENIELLNTFANILSSVIAPEQVEKHTRFMAYNDSLTGLPNRFLFSEKVTEALRIAKRKNQNLAVMFIDLDEFKAVNDTLGHKSGDQLLISVANNLKNVVDENDIVARFGGDEFMILLRNYKDQKTITSLADNIMETFKKNQIIGEQNFNVTASMGISIFPDDGSDSETLVKNADIAMYKAKESGKNKYIISSQKLKDDVALDLQLTSDLRNALAANELIVYYQPQINLKTSKIDGIEALLRWNHPERGIISPGVFIPLAEKSDLINEIGEWVFKQACLLSKKLEEMGLEKIEVAVNLSTVQIINPKLEASFSEILKETKADPSYVVLEITETAAIRETDYVIEVLNKLRKLGMPIAVDDFGTEYSSLSRLKQLPIDQIKIDLQFIQGIETNDKDQAIIKVIIKLAKSLGLTVLAEGIETKAQLQFLLDNDCDYGQGYYFYRPMTTKDITLLLNEKL